MAETSDNTFDTSAFLIKTLGKQLEALGWVSLSWTQMYEAMAVVFARLLSPQKPGHAWAVWHANRSDRSQRDMLKAAAQAILAADDKRRIAIVWAIDQLDSMENKRNDALHAPYTFVLFNGAVIIDPDIETGNRRASNPKGKDPAVELESYRHNFLALSSYFQSIGDALSFPFELPHPALPEPPALPRPAHDHGQKRQDARAKPRSLPRSSRA